MATNTVNTVVNLLHAVGDGLDLSPAEESAVSAVFTELKADLGHAEIRAEVVRRLCLHADMVRGGQPGRFCFIGGTLAGDLDLTGLRLDFGMRFVGTRLSHLILLDTRIVALELIGGTAERIEADRAEVAHDLVMTEGFECSGGAVLRSASVDGDLNCSGGRFSGGKGASIVLDGARIGGRLSLRKERDRRFQADHGVLVRDARIAGGVVCKQGIFEREVEFSRTQVLGDFILSYADIGRRPRGPGGEPDGRLLLDSMHVTGELSLKGTDFHGPKVHLARTRVDGPMRWKLWRTEPKASTFEVDLMQAQVRHLHDDLDHWYGAEVRLDGFSFDGVVVRKKDWLKKRKLWLGRQPVGKWSPHPYDQMHTALRSSGYEKAARAIAVEREAARLRKGGLSGLGQVFHRLYGWLLGYGYKPLRFFLIASLIVIAFSIPFSTLHTCDRTVEATSCGAFAFPTARAPIYHSMLFSLDAFVPADLGQTAAWSPSEAVFAYLVAFESSLGWLFTGLLIGVVTGVLRRD